MVTLSLAMIVRDEAETLARVLVSAREFCDEMIVVDTGSTDATPQLAESLGAKVFDFPWIDDFSAARNYSFEMCRGDWIIWLDADDVVPDCSVLELKNMKRAILTDEIDAVYLPYAFAPTSSGEPAFTICRERLIRSGADLHWQYPVHECIAIPGGRAHFSDKASVHHRPSTEKQKTKHGRNLRILEKAINAGDRSARNLFYYSNELLDNQRFREAISAYREFLEAPGLPWERYSALRSLARCCIELDQREDALSWLFLAIACDSQRAEAFNEIGIIYYSQERWAEAIPFFAAASVVPRPQFGNFIEECHYSWLPFDYLAVCYFKVGDYQKALEMAFQAAPTNPDPDRLLENIRFILSAHGETAGSKSIDLVLNDLQPVSITSDAASKL